MKSRTIIKIFFAILLVLNYANMYCQDFNYQRTWATYFGDENIYIKDNAVDTDGNVYVVGRATGTNTEAMIISTPISYQPNFGGGSSDGFMAKFNSSGNLVYATYFGGEDYDRIEGITIDKDNNIFIIGSTKSTLNIASTNAYQANLNGSSDAFIAKFLPDGSKIWSTYFGGLGAEIGLIDPADETQYIYTGITCDNIGNLYLFNATQSSGQGTVGTFQPNSENSGYLISKFSDTGNRIWSTYYGINQSEIRAISCSSTALYIAGNSYDCPTNPNNQPNTYFATTGGHQSTNGNCRDAFLTKFSQEGQRLWSTYYGGNSIERLTSESIKCSRDYIYMAGATSSTNNIATVGAYQETKLNISRFLVKFNENGERQWGTYCGDNLDGTGENLNCYLNIDSLDNLYLSGSTYLASNIGSLGSYQPLKSGNSDGFVVKFNPNGERIWGTYYGGTSYDNALKLLFHNDSFYILGNTASTQNISTPNSYQPNFIYNNNPLPNPNNIFISKFDVIPLANNGFEKAEIIIYPNPNNGNFSISSNKNSNDNLNIEIYDVLGKLMLKQNVKPQEAIQTKNLASGIYFTNIKSENQIYKTEKIIIK